MTVGSRAGTMVVHPVIVTADLAAAVRYYRDVLGLIPGQTTKHDPERLSRLSGLRDPCAEAVVLTAPRGGEIELVQFHRPAGKPSVEHDWPDAGIKSVTFMVDDLAEVLRRAQAGGYRSMGEVTLFAQADHDVAVVYVGAPDGVVLTLVERGAARNAGSAGE